MIFGMLICPHSNARYMQSLRSLSICELSIIAPEIGQPHFETVSGLELCVFEKADDLIPPALSRHSSLQALFEIKDGWLRPIELPDFLRFDSDIASVLKYKGKTNERFTQMLINIALFSGKTKKDNEIAVLDPLCGRGTTLFQALRQGYHAAGIEADEKDIHELNTYFSRYLTYHKKKHRKEKSSMTVKGRNAGERTSYTIGDLTLRAVKGDTRNAASFFKAESFDALVADLPYGIQHSGLNGKKRAETDALLREALPEWGKLLKKDSTAVLSFNANAISRDALREILSDSGFTPLTGGAYDDMQHWVEQAVTRDVVAAIMK